MRLLALLAATCAACGGDAPGKIVLEGKIPKHLKLTGGASSSTKRDSRFCKGFLLQNPTSKSERRELVFTRLADGRYRAVLDLSYLPFGGFCEWRVSSVGVGIEDVADSRKRSDAVFLVAPSHEELPDVDALPFRPQLAVMCRPRHYDINYMDCAPAPDFVTELKGDLHLSLDVSYTHIPWPDAPSRYQGMGISPE